MDITVVILFSLIAKSAVALEDLDTDGPPFRKCLQPTTFRSCLGAGRFKDHSTTFANDTIAAMSFGQGEFVRAGDSAERCIFQEVCQALLVTDLQNNAIILDIYWHGIFRAWKITTQFLVNDWLYNCTLTNQSDQDSYRLCSYYLFTEYQEAKRLKNQWYHLRLLRYLWKKAPVNFEIEKDNLTIILELNHLVRRDVVDTYGASGQDVFSMFREKTQQELPPTTQEPTTSAINDDPFPTRVTSEPWWLNHVQRSEAVPDAGGSKSMKNYGNYLILIWSALLVLLL